MKKVLSKLCAGGIPTGCLVMILVMGYKEHGWIEVLEIIGYFVGFALLMWACAWGWFYDGK